MANSYVIYQLKPMTARHISCTYQRDHDEAIEIDHIRILSTGPELACNGGKCGGLY